ncbi:MAG: nitroreductase family protein [Halioglobus sp.]|jgi:nitroreductase|tara:strand:+ start:1257 stop:1907 length:651 start_codon:yes stop_codon:yes gene_type:complete
MDKLQSAEYILTTTRAVRKRLDFSKPVERELIEQCLEIALQAPNGSNMNTWKWIIVDDRDKIRKIAKIYDQAMDDYVTILGDATGDNYMGSHIPGAENISESVDYLRKHLAEVPAIAFPLLAGRLEGASVFYQASLWGSILQSVWSFFLALRTKGMGSAWTTAHLFREQEIAALLGIPANYTQVGLFPIAYTLGTEFKKAWRSPVEDVLNWNTFKE